MKRALDGAGVGLSGLVRGADPLREFLQIRERVVADLQPAADQLVELTFVKGGQEAIPFAEVNTCYEVELARVGICAFDDQVTDALRALLDRPTERAFVQQRFTHVLVDEFQDLNAAQLALVDVLCRPRGELFVVGDDDQMIYGWRYAKLTNILDFEERHAAASTYVLSTNYRCARAIVDASRRVIGHNANRVQKAVTARVDAAEGSLRYAVSPRDERLESLVEFVKSAYEEAGEWRKIAVLCRYRSQQLEVAMALDNAGIPRTELLAYKLFSHPAAVLLRAYLALMLRPARIDGESLASVINRPNRFATNELVGKLQRVQAPWVELENHVASEGEQFRVRSLRGFIDRTESLHQRFRETKPAPSVVLGAIVREFGLAEYWSDASKSRSSADDADPLAIVRILQLHAQEFHTSTEFAAYWDRESESERTRGEADSLSREESDEDRVVVSTIHAAKGREYHSVVLHDFDVALEKLAPHEIEEERRVFYVGMTRAERGLLITADEGRLPHRFVIESIRPLEDGEETRLASMRRTLRDEKSHLLGEAGELDDEVCRYESGAELARQREALVLLEEVEATLTGRIGELESGLEHSSVIDAVLGRKRKARAELAELRANFDTALEHTRAQRKLVGRITHDPGAFVDPLRERAVQVRRRLLRTDEQLAAIERREEELRILASSEVP
jgi:superfamily I DNA/RNA helicase